MFAREDWTLFQSLNTLGQKAGVSRDKLARLVVKELEDNAYDALASRVTVEMIQDDTVQVSDDGPGIDGDISVIFSINRPLVSSKLLRLPTRGALGNGTRVVTGAVIATQGSLSVETKGVLYDLEFLDDGTTRVASTEETGSSGTIVTVRLGKNLFSEDGDPLFWAKISKSLRGESFYKGKTSAHWYDEESFFELFKAAGEVSVFGVLKNFDGVKPAWFKGQDMEDEPASVVSVNYATAILKNMQHDFRDVKPSKLGVVGRDAGFGAGYGYAKLETIFSPTGSRSRIPAVLEAWAKPLDKDDDPEIIVAVNRTPITVDINSYVHKGQTAFEGAGLNHYFKSGRRPMSYILNVQAPYMPITTDGKEPDFKTIGSAVLKVMAKVSRVASRLSPGRVGSSSFETQKEVIIRNLDEAIAKASGDGEHRFSLRQLFYAVRPFVLSEFGEEPKYNYFASVITDYEADQGQDIPGIYRDPRGMLHHPHTGEQIPLGTMSVEKYKRPRWTFNKILYVEKGGFFELLKDNRWGERNDCALMTSQGFASRAARDVLDLLGDGEEEIEFYCVHDADGPGTTIYEALSEATRARAARKVKIINLGLDPEDGVEMGLAIEKVERKKGKVPVARYLQYTEWEDWLQTQRIELNAMSSPQFLKWLDRQMAKSGSSGKLVPPADVMLQELEAKVLANVTERMTKKAILEAKVEERAKAFVDEADPLSYGEKKLTNLVEQALKRKPVDRWLVPVHGLAETLAEEK